MIEPMEIDEHCILGVTRAYQTRHGAGPLPTFDRDLDTRLSDPGNPANAWQGAFRHGWLDLVLLRYAAEMAGAPLDGLVVNHLDEAALKSKVCVAYRLPVGNEIDRLPAAAAPNLAGQERLTAILQQASPIYEPISASGIRNRLAAEIAPLAITANGPTWRHRELQNLQFHSLFLGEAQSSVSANTAAPAGSPA
jgi:adenylosuccinate synthase